MKMIQEFREFISRGSVVDLAVGVIIGTAFGKIVTSLVNDIITPPLGLLIKSVNFSDLFLPLSSKGFGKTLVQAKADADPVITYGAFINEVIAFLITAFCIFILVKAINRLRRKQEAKPAPPAAPTKSEVLLEEIRDLLKK